jgi:Cu/Ag efflux pump CusA
MEELNQDQAAEQQQEQGTEQQATEQANTEQPDAKYKSEIAGLNRKIAEMQKQMKESSMTAEQKTEALKKEKAELEQETATLRRNLIIEREMAAAGLPEEMAVRIYGDNENEIKEDIQKLKDYIQNLAKTEVANRTTGFKDNEIPQDGEAPERMSYEKIAQLPDHAERMKLYRKHGYIK